MNLFQNKVFPLKYLVKITGQNLIFPFYHIVSDSPPPHIRCLYPIKSKMQFEKELDLLLKNFEALSPEIFLGSNPEQVDKPSMILSFDDGLSEVYDVIAPVLLRKGIPAIFFLNNSFIDNKDLFFRYKASVLADLIRNNELSPDQQNLIRQKLGVTDLKPHRLIRSVLNIGWHSRNLTSEIAGLARIDFQNYLEKNKPYMESTQIRDLINKGFYVGAHSYMHPLFEKLSPAEQISEVLQSVQDIRNRFEIEYSFFAFPFNDVGVSKEVLEKLYNNKHIQLDASFGTAGLKKPEKYPHYQRIPVEKGNDSAVKYIQKQYFRYILKKLAGRNRIKR